MRGNWIRLVTAAASVAALAGAVGLPATLVVRGHERAPKLATPPTVSKSVVRAAPGAIAVPRVRPKVAPRPAAAPVPAVAQLVSAPVFRPHSRPVVARVRPKQPARPAPSASVSRPKPAPIPAPTPAPAPQPAPPASPPGELVSNPAPVEPSTRRSKKRRHTAAQAAQPSRVLAEVQPTTPAQSGDDSEDDSDDDENDDEGDAPGATPQAPTPCDPATPQQDDRGGKDKPNGNGKGKEKGKGR